MAKAPHSTLKAFLGIHQQRVVVEGDDSDFVPLTSGVSQGSVLGPVLFLAYINDLSQAIISHVHLFTDYSDCLQRDLDRLQACEMK